VIGFKVFPRLAIFYITSIEASISILTQGLGTSESELPKNPAVGIETPNCRCRERVKVLGAGQAHCDRARSFV
jgi:hypothetical protein